MQGGFSTQTARWWGRHVEPRRSRTLAISRAHALHHRAAGGAANTESMAARSVVLGSGRHSGLATRLAGVFAGCRGDTASVALEIWRALREPSVRVLHLCGWGGHCALMPSILFASLRGIPVVVESDTQAPFISSVARRAIKGALYPALFRVPRMFLPGGTRQMRYLRGYGVPDNRMRIARMTVDVASIMRFAHLFEGPRRAAWRAEHGIDERANVFLFVGRLEEHKGIRSLVSAFEVLVQADPSARLVIVGDGSLRDEVRRAADDCDWLVTCGRLQDSALLAAYCAADVFVLPSSFEPWGLVVNEAMACGLPIIASDRVGCVDDLVKDQDTGIIYSQTESSQLLDALHALASQSEARARMGRDAKRVIAGWTLRDEAEQIVAAWRLVA